MSICNCGGDFSFPSSPTRVTSEKSTWSTILLYPLYMVASDNKRIWQEGGSTPYPNICSDVKEIHPQKPNGTQGIYTLFVKIWVTPLWKPTFKLSTVRTWCWDAFRPNFTHSFSIERPKMVKVQVLSSPKFSQYNEKVLFWSTTQNCLLQALTIAFFEDTVIWWKQWLET